MTKLNGRSKSIRHNDYDQIQKRTKLKLRIRGTCRVRDINIQPETYTGLKHSSSTHHYGKNTKTQRQIHLNRLKARQPQIARQLARDSITNRRTKTKPKSERGSVKERRRARRGR